MPSQPRDGHARMDEPIPPEIGAQCGGSRGIELRQRPRGVYLSVILSLLDKRPIRLFGKHKP